MRSLLFASCLSQAAGVGLELSVDRSTGAFEISLGSQTWLEGGLEYQVGASSSSAGTLTLQRTSTSQGVDAFGHHQATELHWARAQDSQVIMKTIFRAYPGKDDILVFEQQFPEELKLGSIGDSGLSSSTVFPSFTRHAKSSSSPLSCFSYHADPLNQQFPNLQECDLSTYKESLLGGSPLVLYNASDPALPMTVFSPLDWPMAHHMAHTDTFIGAGVKATVDVIPAGWSQTFLLSASTGINDGMMAWGNRLLTWTGRPVVDNRYRDDSHGAIGFWTDNGGFYHYSLGDNKSLGSTYEEVLPKVKAYHDELGIPFKHWQFDSWFYPKDAPVIDSGGLGGGVTNWTALPEIFPHGMAHIQSLLGLPIIMHNRQWSTNSDYIHNWTDIEWYISKNASIPKDPVKFFERFFTQQEGWGLSMYEQDWMDLEYKEVEALQRNISMGDLWLYGMNQGAAKSNRTVQFCMPLPNEVLSAAWLPAVTNVRATGDYFHSTDNWAVGQTALFYWALNILPFKDGFYSSSLKQVGGQTVGPETDPDREALMATLSAAMVGPMDGIYLLNKSRIMTTCRGDGQVLKPDRPLTPPDACFRRGEPSCRTYVTHSDVAGLGRVRYYFNNNGSAPLLADEVDAATSNADHAVFNWYTSEVVPLTHVTKLRPGYEDHIYATVAPVVHGWAFVGEVDKFVTASTLRFDNVTITNRKLSAWLTGTEGEEVRVCVARSSSWKLECKKILFEATATAEVSFTADDFMNTLLV